MSSHALSSLSGLDAEPSYGVGLMVWATTAEEAGRVEFWQWVPESPSWVLWVFVSSAREGRVRELGRLRVQRDTNCNVLVSECSSCSRWSQELRGALELANGDSVLNLQQVSPFAL